RVAPPVRRTVTFADPPRAGVDRAVVRYQLVPLLDLPDEVRGVPTGDLQAGDEVETIGKRGVWTEVRTPHGAVGWVHRTTLDRIATATLDDLPLAGSLGGPPEAAASGRRSASAGDDVAAPGDLERLLARIVSDRAAAGSAAPRFMPLQGGSPGGAARG